MKSGSSGKSVVKRCRLVCSPVLSQLTSRCVWFSVTELAEEVSVLGLSSAGSVLESAAAELLQSAAQREWPVLI